MFVLQSTYDRLSRQLLETKMELATTTRDWNLLIRRINKKGGEAFLQQGNRLTDKEITKLISLCHPDKHGGKKSAVEMTQKLLKLRSE